jgi:integrase
LAEARQRAHLFRDQLFHGIDPIEARKAGKAAQQAKEALEKARAITFDQCARAYIEAHEAAWRNAKHRAQWVNTLRKYASPVFGSMRVEEITTEHLLAALKPVWLEKPETASRLRGRIERVLAWAAVNKHRQGDNPARWRAHLDELLPKKSKIRAVRHHPALPWREIGSFMAALRLQTSVAAACLEFTILTASRSGEARGATWAEIDFTTNVWAIPSTRMKAGVEHRVPLSKPALSILSRMSDVRTDPRPSALVFSGSRHGRPLSDVSLGRVIRITGAEATTHGMRSCFRDWAAEVTNFPRELAERALAHALSSAVEAAYQRGDMFQKRRRLMEAWSQFCGRAASTGKVLTMNRGG